MKYWISASKKRRRFEVKLHHRRRAMKLSSSLFRDYANDDARGYYAINGCVAGRLKRLAYNQPALGQSVLEGDARLPD
jgi:hypothetical protein